MTIANRSVPAATVIPTLAYADVLEAADWLCNAFGFAVRLRIADHRAQLVYGDGAGILTRLGESDRAGANSVHVRVEDADAHHERARSSGSHHPEPAHRSSLRREAVLGRGSRRPPLDVLAVDRRRRPCRLGRGADR
jgi:hypothetical protein